jgi:Legume lectin domain
VPVDLSTVADSSGFTYVGFTASTGNGFENHDILTWDFRTEKVSSDGAVVYSEIHFLPTNCLEGRNLCTPAEAIVEQKSPGLFHVVLPAHLEWGASIPNPDSKPVTVSGRLGSVCWLGVNAGGFDCSGPDGASSDSRSDLLVPESNRGALVIKTEGGRTWFSVNGRKGSDFSKNQGLFQFDVRLD